MFDMWTIADNLALAQSPVTCDRGRSCGSCHDSAWGRDEFNPIVASIRCKDFPISYGKLYDVLTDYERLMCSNEQPFVIAIANSTQRIIGPPPPSSMGVTDQ